MVGNTKINYPGDATSKVSSMLVVADKMWVGTDNGSIYILDAKVGSVAILNLPTPTTHNPHPHPHPPTQLPTSTHMHARTHYVQLTHSHSLHMHTMHTSIPFITYMCAVFVLFSIFFCLSVCLLFVVLMSIIIQYEDRISSTTQ